MSWSDKHARIQSAGPSNGDVLNAEQVLQGVLSYLQNALRVTQVAPDSTDLTTATLADASKTVAATGTPEALGSGTVREVFIFPLRTNTGDVYWGTTSTNDTQHGTLPVVLTAPPGKVIDLADIYLDVTVNGEGVRYITNN